MITNCGCGWTFIMVQAGYLKLINNDPLKLGQIITITPLLFLDHREGFLSSRLWGTSVPAMGALEYIKPTKKASTLCFFFGS
jgi:hypothetical protein